MAGAALTAASASIRHKTLEIKGVYISKTKIELSR